MKNISEKIWKVFHKWIPESPPLPYLIKVYLSRYTGAFCILRNSLKLNLIYWNFYNKTHKRSFIIIHFKDSLIEISEKKDKAPTQPKLEEKMATEEKKPDEPTKEKTKSEPKYDPLYWPLNPTGPIR